MVVEGDERDLVANGMNNVGLKRASDTHLHGIIQAKTAKAGKPGGDIAQGPLSRFYAAHPAWECEPEADKLLPKKSSNDG